MSSLDLGKALKWIRQERRLTQAELARASGLSITFLSKLERGERRWISLSNAERLAEAFRIPFCALFVLADQSKDARVKTVQAAMRELIRNRPRERLRVVM